MYFLVSDMKVQGQAGNPVFLDGTGIGCKCYR